MVPRPLAALLMLSALLLAAPAAAGAWAVPPAAGADAAPTGGPPTAAPQPVGQAVAPQAGAAQTGHVQAAPSDVVFAITLESDGDARWRVSATFPLDDENATTGFRELAEAFESGEAAPLGLDSFRAAAAEASEATGREMAIEDVGRAHRIENDTGELILTFRWTNFARVQRGALHVGDAFNTTSGTWLPSLTERQTLTIEPPPGYDVRSAPVGVTDGVARWEGPQDFEGRDPWIVYTGAGPTPPGPTTSVTPNNTTTTTTATSSPGTETNATTTTPGGTVSSSLPIAAFVLLVGAVALAAYIFRDSDGVAGVVPDIGDEGPGDGSVPAGEASQGGADSAPDGAGGAAAGAAAGDAGSAAEDDVDVELLSDEERVERLLDRNGGRMKQANIVKETGWSNAKVSQLLSSMEEEGRIDKLRIGRENLISFPDEDVTDFETD